MLLRYFGLWKALAIDSPRSSAVTGPKLHGETAPASPMTAFEAAQSSLNALYHETITLPVQIASPPAALRGIISRCVKRPGSTLRFQFCFLACCARVRERLTADNVVLIIQLQFDNLERHGSPRRYKRHGSLEGTGYREKREISKNVPARPLGIPPPPAEL
jgi:hypothetical protein